GGTGALIREAMRSASRHRPLLFAAMRIPRAACERYYRAPTTMPLGVRLALAAALEEMADEVPARRLRRLGDALTAATERVITVALRGAALATQRGPGHPAPPSELLEALLWCPPPDRDLP
ncbi:MAG TPA: hypothetical protein VMT93_08535, partial [Gemmatimonadaceae bacterium]|nr:hypothetical protein [Gemmatimonadaceae bacterium]